MHFFPVDNERKDHTIIVFVNWPLLLKEAGHFLSVLFLLCKNGVP